MFVSWLGQVEGELIVDSEVVETRVPHGVAMVVTLLVATFAVIADDAFRCAMATSGFIVARFALIVAFAS